MSYTWHQSYLPQEGDCSDLYAMKHKFSTGVFSETGPLPNHFDAKTGHFYGLLKFPLFKGFTTRIASNLFYFSNQLSANKISMQ